jgi:hypothetical protein
VTVYVSGPAFHTPALPPAQQLFAGVPPTGLGPTWATLRTFAATLQTLESTAAVTATLMTSANTMATIVNGQLEYFVGDEADVLVSFADRLGRPVDPGAVSLLVHDPLGNTTTYTYPSAAIVRNAQGQYEGLFMLTLPKTWVYRWVGTGANPSAAEASILVQTPAF